ncbi:hypothetical protein D3C87_1884520 [compost metagenome]
MLGARFIVRDALFAFDREAERHARPLPKLCHLPALLRKPRQPPRRALLHSGRSLGERVDTAPASEVARLRLVAGLAFEIECGGFRP